MNIIQYTTDLVYLACPYSHERDDIRVWRFNAVNSVAASLMQAGVLVFSPISHTHPIGLYGLPDGWDFWERYDRPFLQVCKALVVLQLDGWENSVGVAAEVKIMREAGKPVFFIEPLGEFDAVIESLKV